MSGLTQGQRSATLGIYVVIVAVYFVIPDMGYIAPSLSAIAQTYGVDAGEVSYLATLVALMQIAGAFACSLIAGKRMKYKTVLLVAVGGMAVFGMAPGLFTADVPYSVLMVDRAIFGFFLGFLQPIIYAYIAFVFVDASQRATVYGWGNVSFNVGAVFASSVGGLCVGIGWNTAFWLYSIGIVVLACVALFFREPDGLVRSEPGERVRISPLAWFFMSVLLVSQVFDYPFFTVFIDSLIAHGITDGVVGGQLLSLFTLVGIVASALFGVFFKRLKSFVLPLACVLAGIGMAMIWAGVSVFSSLAFCVAAVCVVGAGQCLITVGVPQCVSISCSPVVATAALAYTAIFMNLGTFVSSPYVQIVANIAQTTDYSMVFLVSGVAMLIFSAVVFAVVKRFGKREVSSAVVSE